MYHVKRGEEKENRLINFTVCFYDKYVLIGDKRFPLGQLSCDILLLSDEKLDKLRELALSVRERFIKDCHKFKIVPKHNFETTLKSVRMYFKYLSLLPVYKELNINLKSDYKPLKNYLLNLTASSTPDYIGKVSDIIEALIGIYDEIMYYKTFISIFIDEYLDKVKKRTPEEFSKAFYNFFGNEELLNEIHEEMGNPKVRFILNHQTRCEYTTFVNKDTNKYQIAERYEFISLVGFMVSDFMKALATGHSIRRCKWCKEFFLVTTAADKKYCDRPAPNDKKGRPCSKVGPHGNERNAENKPPYLIEARRTYERARKQEDKGIITSYEYWDILDKIYSIKESVKDGEITADDATEMLKNMCRVKRS